MKKEVRHTIFFKFGTDLAVFHSKAVNVRAREALGFPVKIKELQIDPSALLNDGIKRHFWVVTEYPEKLTMRLGEDNYAVRGTSGYRIAQPSDTDALKLLRLAEDKARAILFTAETVAAT
jgi:hypothetical protein